MRRLSCAMSCSSHAIELPAFPLSGSFRHFALEVGTVLLPLLSIYMGLIPPGPAFWALVGLYCWVVLLPLYRVSWQYSTATLGPPQPSEAGAGRASAEMAGSLSESQLAGALNLGDPRKL